MMNRTRMVTSLSWTGSGGSHVGLLGDVGGEGMKFFPCSFDTAVSAIIASSDGDMDYVNTPVAAERVYIKTRSDVEELIETRIQAVAEIMALPKGMCALLLQGCGWDKEHTIELILSDPERLAEKARMLFERVPETEVCDARARAPVYCVLAVMLTCDVSVPGLRLFGSTACVVFC